MFAKNYQNTLKTLLRTPTFWLMLAVLMVMLTYNNAGFLKAAIRSERLLDADSYHNLINNIPVAKFMVYPMPLFAVVSTVLILNRDYGDQFFEIEKAYAVRPICYLSSRLSALITVNTALIITLGFLYLHLNVFLHGGVEGMSVWDYLADSFVRIMRVCWLLCIPSLSAFITLTYAVGTVFKSGVAAMIASSIYVIVFYLGQLTLHMRYEPIVQVYLRYLSPLPRALRLHAAMADTGYYKSALSMHNDQPIHIVLGFCSLICSIGLGAGISYFRIRKRNV